MRSLAIRTHTYIQHKLPNPKAEYVSSSFTTTILQHRGMSPKKVATGLNIRFILISGDHNTVITTENFGADGEKPHNHHPLRQLTLPPIRLPK